MNKVYNTVWNESTGMWVVTSELTRKGGRRPRQIRRTALAGLIAGLFLPSAPALAVDYNNETLGSGATSSSMSLNAGDTATDTTINSGGNQYVSGGGSATSTTINSGGYQYVSSGGSATDTTINSGGSQYVSSGGSATNITNDGGYLSIDGNVTDITVNGGNNMYSGSATNVTINGGNNNMYGGSATSVTINGAGLNMYGGSATSTTINGGYQNIFGGSATDTTLNSGGYQYIDDSASVTSTTINSGGYQSVSSGGSATDTIINSGGILGVSGGGTAVDITQNSGGAISADTSAALSGTNINGSFSIANGSASNMLLENGGYLAVLNGHQATDTTINSGGSQYVSSGGSATNTIIHTGGIQNISGGSVTDTTLNDGGEQNVENGGVAANTVINSGGNQKVNYGGSATSTIINSSGYQTVYNGGSATNTIINTGGIQNISGGSVTDTTLNDGGEQNVENGGVAANTVINSGGTQKVNSGGSVTDTTINSGGGQYVYVNGNVTKTTITDGGILQVDAGGSASQVTQNSGGAIITNTSAVLSGTNDKGTFSIAGGSAVNMLLENGGLLTVLGGHDASDTTVGSDGTLSVQSGGVLRGTTTLTDKGTLVGDVVTNEGNLYFLNNSAATFAGTLTGSGTLTQEGGNTRFSGLLSQDGGITLQSGAAMTMVTLQANANVTTQPGTTLTLDNGSILTGSVTGDNSGAGNMTVKGASVWHLDGDSTVGALTLDNGTVDFRPSATTRLTQAFRSVSLVSERLSGNGTFRMNTDIASHTGDMLNVTGNASGNFVLDIRNTGLEPVSAGTPLQVVHTGSGDAAFSLNGGKVDAGTWEYYLNKENTDWYLKADSSQPGTDNPGTDNPGTDNPGTDNPGTDNPGTDNPGTDNPVPPVRHTTKSADAVLDMATAPVYVFNSELQSLRFRHGDVMQNTRSPGGVWGRYTGSDTRISGGAGSGYSLTQSGMETGGDTVFELKDSRLAVGAFVSYTDNSISHNRGGSSTVGSTGGGLYATWFNNDGYYVDGVVKVNRFRNELRTWMSDGTAVKGDYHQNGFGGSLEAGRTFSLNENTWIQPYLRSTAFRAESKDISLDNGMKAKAGTTKSLQGEVGVNLGMNLDVAGTVVRPYLTTAVSHEFSDNNRVRINDSYNFTNDISGTTGKYGAGVSAQLTANAGVWAEASYQNGENTESPVTGSVGFRINF
ncbi:autotransporter outer membrane beta-barrel domain-containing protein [Escherichia coli]|uniref:autotransporter outer membrane beta-barrel domain-containing protein n=1 Tax=Escherichia coli TaxID=562 RepID=UPI00101F87EC|nr:autotransporter outer membrane beta-barrel domain-containing protein [Escherichia coli]NAH05882.1 autotransporter outer membrane beta-barrel domain-containing protein [Escherichia coli]NAH60031.1 autotransporter outer membrane beta-barrel domain-containing protein [Escherichia coli]NAH64706.1 autotransporter outer membrane beta-barrel domain-containing protein [Escherichia coli]NAI54487.1 autotransporter outer membrane beta-barrel domain-containing protein [Escherichia coli]NAL58766.1 autot